MLKSLSILHPRDPLLKKNMESSPAFTEIPKRII